MVCKGLYILFRVGRIAKKLRPEMAARISRRGDVEILNKT